jgi:hypothetical protein
MWAITKHILYQRRYLLLLLFFLMSFTYFVGMPLMVFVLLVFCASIFQMERKRPDIKVYRSLPVSRLNLSRVLWFFLVLAGPIAATIIVGIHFASDSTRSVTEYQSYPFTKDFPFFFFIILCLLSLKFVISFSGIFSFLLSRTFPLSSKTLELILELLILIPSLIVILLIHRSDLPQLWVLPPILLTSGVSLFLSWRSNDRTFYNGRFFEMEPKNELRTIYKDHPVSYDNAYLSFYWTLFKPFPVSCAAWIIYYLAITPFSNLMFDEGIPAFFYFITNLFCAYVILLIVSQNVLSLFSILLILPIRRIFVGLYLIGFPALCCGAGIGIGMTLESLLPNSGIVTIPGWYNLIHCVFLAPVLIILGLYLGISGIFASLGLVLINLIFYFDMSWDFESSGGFLGFFLLVNLIISCYSIYYVFLFLFSAQKAARFDTRLELKGFG